MSRRYYHPSRAMVVIGTRVARRQRLEGRRAPTRASMVPAEVAPAAMARDAVLGGIAVVVASVALTLVLAHVI